MKTIVIIPTYNEAKNIKDMIKSILALNKNIEILVVDDNSPDRTWQIVRKMRQKDSKIHLIINKTKIGLGPAYLIGISFALRENYDNIIQMDCDFSHDPKMIPKLLKYLGKYDYVIGSRYTKGGSIVGWEKSRKMLSYFGNLYARSILGISIKDWTSGFICWKKEALASINLLNGDHPNGYAFLVSLKYKAKKAGFKPKEVPIIFRDRTRGETKMNGGIVNEAAITIIKMRLSKNKNSIAKKN